LFDDVNEGFENRFVISNLHDVYYLIGE
jgi:hypothetical protein